MSLAQLSEVGLKDCSAIEAYVEEIRRRYPHRILNVVLFGSKARGDDDDESDIDLLVVVDTEDADFRSQLWRIASDVSLEHGVVLSVRVFGEARWLEAQTTLFPLWRFITSEGITLWSETDSVRNVT